MSQTGETSNKYGRVNEDGTAYLITPQGERAVGSWQAGTPSEGFAHFTRRYEDMSTDVNLLAARLASKAASPQQTVESALRIQQSLPDAAIIGDVAALESKLNTIIEQARAAAGTVTAEKKAARERAVAHKEELVAQAEQLAGSTQWKATGEQLAEIARQWKAESTADRTTDKALWKRYAAARDEFNKRRGSHFSTLDAARKVTAAQKEDLISRTEALADSTDWGPAAAQLKQLMTEWKSLPRLAKDTEDQLWKRFRTAQDHFFARRSQALSEAEQERKQHRAAQQVAGDQRREKAAANNPLLAQIREQVERATKHLERARNSGDATAIAESEQALRSKQHVLKLAERAGKA